MATVYEICGREFTKDRVIYRIKKTSIVASIWSSLFGSSPTTTKFKVSCQRSDYNYSGSYSIWTHEMLYYPSNKVVGFPEWGELHDLITEDGRDGRIDDIKISEDLK